MLKMLSVKLTNLCSTREVECPSQGVVLLDCYLSHNDLIYPVSLHWRVGTWIKPPLDIQIDPDTGMLRALQIVLQDESIGTNIKSIKENRTIDGIPIFEIPNWPSNRYLDIRAQVDIFWSKPDQIFVELGMSAASYITKVKIDELLSLFFDSENELVGIGIYKITSTEKEEIKKAEVVTNNK